MESPTPLSETNLKRYKGIRTTKKRQHSCADFYLNHKESEDDETLGPRSVSLTALVSPDQKRSQSAIEPSRMSQLETLEAKMAKIEVSLSTLGLQQHHHSNHQHHVPQRRKRNSVTPSVRSLHSVPHLNGSAGGNNNCRDAQIAKELELLRQNLKDKDHLVINLQAQLRKLSKRKLLHGSITSTDSGVVSLRILSDSERKTAEERLGQLDKEMEVKRSEIKRINHRLERLDPSDNIDVRIQQAELEYELEREELNLMNMQEERRNLHTILDDNDAFQKKTENSLFASMVDNNPVALYSFEVMYDSQNPCFTVGKREDRTGTYVTWTRDDLKTLKRGDRIVEINGTIIIAKGVNRVEEFWLDEGSTSGNGSGVVSSDDTILGDTGSNPFRLVVMRTPPPPPPPRIPNRELHMLKEEVAIVSAKLEQVNDEKREMQSVMATLQKDHALWEEAQERLRTDADKLVKERDNLRTESVRLKHRISYLEEQVAELIHRKDITNGIHPQPITVFQKGNQKTIVAETTTKENNQCSNSPSRPPSVTSRNGETKALKTRLWETFRRATTSDARSVCSVDSRRPNPSENGYFKKRCPDSRKIKSGTNPEPPQKPIRLSLQRATSTNNVYSTGVVGSRVDGMTLTSGSSGSGDLTEVTTNQGLLLKRSNYSEHTLLPDWAPSHDEVRSEVSEKKKNGSAGSKHGIRWPSLRPASSMSYTMTNSRGNNMQQVKF